MSVKESQKQIIYHGVCPCIKDSTLRHCQWKVYFLQKHDQKRGNEWRGTGLGAGCLGGNSNEMQDYRKRPQLMENWAFYPFGLNCARHQIN